MTDSIKTNFEEQKRPSSGKPAGKDESSKSRSEDERFDSLQKELLLRARKRAEAASSNPSPPAATDDYVPATPTRIGQPAFQATDSDYGEDQMRREAEQADTLPSFPAPADAHSEQKETSPASEPERERRPPEVVLRAEVVVADVEERAEKAQRSELDRRDSRRVLLRDSSAPAAIEEDDTSGLHNASGDDDSTGTSDGGYIRSEAIAFDEFTANDPLMTATFGPNGQQPSLAPGVADIMPSAGATTVTVEMPGAKLESSPGMREPRRSQKGINLGLASAVVIFVAVAGLFFIQRWAKPKAVEPPKQEPSAQTAHSASAQPDVPMTEVISNPVGAELVHQGAVVGNTPTKIERPTFEQIYLLRYPGYKSQLLRISPTSGKTVHVTLQPSDNPASQ